MKPSIRKQIGIIGAGTCSSATRALAEAVGKEVAKKGAILLCGIGHARKGKTGKKRISGPNFSYG